jgi:hypothetical protein
MLTIAAAITKYILSAIVNNKRPHGVTLHGKVSNSVIIASKQRLLVKDQ